MIQFSCQCRSECHVWFRHALRKRKRLPVSELQGEDAQYPVNEALSAKRQKKEDIASGGPSTFDYNAHRTDMEAFKNIHVNLAEPLKQTLRSSADSFADKVHGLTAKIGTSTSSLASLDRAIGGASLNMLRLDHQRSVQCGRNTFMATQPNRRVNGPEVLEIAKVASKSKSVTRSAGVYSVDTISTFARRMAREVTTFKRK